MNKHRATGAPRLQMHPQQVEAWEAAQEPFYSHTECTFRNQIPRKNLFYFFQIQKKTEKSGSVCYPQSHLATKADICMFFSAYICCGAREKDESVMTV